MITLRDLVTRLGDDLQPAHGRTVSTSVIAGVHISELDDPTPFLDGGELLLTTGIPFRRIDLDDYIERLAAHGVAALGVGLGLGLDTVPHALLSAADRFGLEVLVVPAETPFLRVSRAYWDLVGRTEQAALIARLDAQTALARAATRDSPVAAVVKTLAESLGGWAVYLPAGGEPETVWPAGGRAALPELRVETAKFGSAGAYSAASFSIAGTGVIEHSIVVGHRTTGFLAVGAGRSPRRAERQTILTACMLLTIVLDNEARAVADRAIRGALLADLVLAGESDAARSVSRLLDGIDLPDPCRVIVSRGAGHPSGVTTLHGDLRITLVPVGEASPEVAGIAGVISDPVELEEVRTRLPTLERACRLTPVGSLVLVPDLERTRAADWVAALTAYARADLRGTVLAYLRGRGQWEAASRELGIHRNSLRHRIATASGILGEDLDDPDVAAELWLALRSAGAL